LFTNVMLFWDGIVHNNLTGIDSFWSFAHIFMYLGVIGLAVWITMVVLRHQDDHQVLDISQIPYGYGLAVIALPLAAVAGPADFIWHSSFGFENQIDSTYSPPHQGLFVAGALLAAIPAASAWKRPGTRPSLREFLPANLSVMAVASLVLFVIHQLSPFYVAAAVTSDFQDDLARFNDAYSAEGPNSEGLARALVHYGDDRWPYYFYSTHATIAGILLFTIVTVGAILLMRRRWTLPIGTVTVMFTSLGLLYAMLSEYREWALIPSLVLAGVAGDILLLRLVGERSNSWRMRLFAALLPAILWVLYFITVAISDGLGWSATLWCGVVVSAALLGFLLTLTTIPPAGPPGEPGA
jgi:hypothetical protein